MKKIKIFWQMLLILLLPMPSWAAEGEQRIADICNRRGPPLSFITISLSLICIEQQLTTQPPDALLQNATEQQTDPLEILRRPPFFPWAG